MKEVCSNCGNPWLDAYSVAGKCSACGAHLSPNDPGAGDKEEEHGGT